MIEVRFHEKLDFFLRRKNRKKGIRVSYKGKRSVKDLIESLGVPHVEVGYIFVDGMPVDFHYLLNSNETVEVFPNGVLSCGDNCIKLKPENDCATRFVLDVHLRKQAFRMRLLGLDTDYSENRNDSEIAFISSSRNRLLLTRDRQLLMRKNIVSGMYVMSTGTENQIVEVLERLDLWECCRPFTRCISCNGDLIEIHDRLFIKKWVPPGVREWCTEYHTCTSCKKVYWEGSHFHRMKKIVEEIMGSRR
jgi:uncharacterized protein with PIN domain